MITTDAVSRRGKEIDLAGPWQKAVQGTGVSRVVTVGSNYDDFVRNAPKARTEAMDAEEPLFILYTSGTTGEPKGTMQVRGGFTVVAAQQAAYLIDMKPDDILFWYADIAWITGQVWVVYGSPIMGATALVYDDARLSGV